MFRFTAFTTNNTCFCKVKNCRFPSTHTTRGHVCGSCHSHGHGKIECGNHFMIQQLSQFFHEVLPKSMWCSVYGCKYAAHHTTDGHSHGNSHGHSHSHLASTSQPSINVIKELTLFQRGYDVILIKTLLKPTPSYVHVHEGMGCFTIVRRLNLFSPLEALFVHSDDVYDKHKLMINDAFVNGFVFVDLSRPLTHNC